MSKKRNILLAALLVALMGGIVWLLIPPPEPTYKGKPLSYWLAGYVPVGGNGKSTHSGPTYQQADEAVCQIGTNAIPYLLRMLRSSNPSLTDRLVALAKRQKWIKISSAPANLNVKAFHAFMALGPQASNAVPPLIDMLETSLSPFAQTAAPAILGRTGHAAEPAIPALLRGMANTNASVRNNVIHALGEIHTQPKLVVPALIQCLNDSDEFVQTAAIQALGAFGWDAQSALPALLELRRKEALRVANVTRPNSAGVIVFPISAVSASGVRMYSGPMKSFSGNFFGYDRFERTQDAIKAIDPEAAAKAGIK